MGWRGRYPMRVAVRFRLAPLAALPVLCALTRVERARVVVLLRTGGSDYAWLRTQCDAIVGSSRWRRRSPALRRWLNPQFAGRRVRAMFGSGLPTLRKISEMCGCSIVDSPSKRSRGDCSVLNVIGGRAESHLSM
jgi:hypothetical protein